MPNDAQLRAICRDRCAAAGDPPCHTLDARAGEIWTACSDCCAEAGIPFNPAEPLDPNAVLRPLI